MQKLSQLESVLLLKYLSDGKINPFLESPKRIRRSYSSFECLYQFHLYHKNLESGKWADIYTSKETIADHSGLCRATVTKFITSSESSLLLDVRKGIRRKGKHSPNRYSLKPEIRQAMLFLERKGFFKGMKENRQKWRRWFDQRLEKWLIPLLEKGLSFSQILKGESSMLSTAKIAAVKTPKIAATTLRSSPTTHSHLDNPVVPPSFLQPIGYIYGTMRDRLQIPEWQIKSFILNNNLNMLTSCVKEADLQTRGNWKPDRMCAYLQAKINKRKSI